MSDQYDVFEILERDFKIYDYKDCVSSILLEFESYILLD